jgi:hypothetical protein
MTHSPSTILDARPLTPAEQALAAWMLMNGSEDAAEFLAQLERASVASRCSCGCASIDFAVDGVPAPRGPLNILGDFLYGQGDALSGAFIFAVDGTLAGLEVYRLAGDAPAALPQPNDLGSYDSEVR